MPRRRTAAQRTAPSKRRAVETEAAEYAPDSDDQEDTDSHAEQEPILAYEHITPTVLGADTSATVSSELSRSGYVLRPSSTSDSLHQLHGFKAWEGETDAEVKARHDAYQHVKRCLDERVAATQQSVVSEVCNSLVKFIREVDLDDPLDDTIPTAVLLTGYNLGDRAIMHEEIWKLLYSSALAIARVEPQHCTNLKRVVKHMMSSFIPNAKDVVGKRWQLAELQKWRSTLPAASKSAPLLVFLDEVQSCSPSVLQDLIEICHLHQRALRFIFIISLHSSAQALRELLPRSTMDHLRLEPFKLEPSVQWLKRIVSELFVSGGLPVRFSGVVLRDINCNFHMWNLSVWRFVRCLQLLVLDFFSRPLSVFAMETSSVQRRPFHINYAIDYFESVSRLKPKELAAKWDSYMADLRAYHRRFPALFRIYHSLIYRQNEPNTLEHNVYASCLLSGAEHAIARAAQLPPALYQVWPDPDDRRALHRAPFDPARMQTLAELWLKELQSLPDEDSQKPILVAELSGLLEKLKNEMRTPLSPLSSKRNLRDSSTSATASTRLLREQALAQAMGNDDLTAARASQARRTLRNWLHRLFDDCLPSPDTFPLHELYYDTKLSLLHVLYPEMERVLESGLLLPGQLLNCQCCTGAAANQLSSTLPDVCIAFHLMRKERTRELNLYDWLQGFSEIVKARGEQDDQVQARFFQAVDSLQLLGYVRKGNCRKADHVTRTDL